MPNHTNEVAASTSNHLDNVQAKLNQADAVLTLLLTEGGAGRFTTDHDTVMSVLWTATDLIQAAQQASQQAFSAYISEHMALIPPAAPSQA
jgi:hypothetical protein